MGLGFKQELTHFLVKESGTGTADGTGLRSVLVWVLFCRIRWLGMGKHTGERKPDNQFLPGILSHCEVDGKLLCPAKKYPPPLHLP